MKLNVFNKSHLVGMVICRCSFVLLIISDGHIIKIRIGSHHRHVVVVLQFLHRE
jgi:hypothetical protein